MKKVIIITGLTCSGKSDLAINIAKNYNGEIISADSVQIYRGLDIGSAKISKDEMSIVPHHLIDIRDFNEEYNVGDFINDTADALDEIVERDKLPIIVGGTGMYIKALVSGYSLGGAKSDIKFRDRYERLSQEKGNQYVWDLLNKIDPDLASKVHPNNIKRVIRYLEIAQNGDQDQVSKTDDSILKDYDVLLLGIIDEREKIYAKINDRVDLMIDMGLETEVRDLIKRGATRETHSMNSIGYKEWFDYFEGKIDYDKLIDLIKQHTRNYCKRQLTFMKTIPNIEICTVEQASKRIKEFLNDRDR